jgi:hypothetical protein
MRPSLDMYPAVETPRRLLTWEDAIRLSHHEPVVRAFVTYAERDEMTREQALLAAVFALYNQKASLFRGEVDRRNREMPDFVMIGDKRYDRTV